MSHLFSKLMQRRELDNLNYSRIPEGAMNAGKEETEARIQRLEETIAHILERNRRVEKDKGWETSWARVLAIVALTYIVMCLVFHSLGNELFWLNAIVPTIGFYLSTLSMRWFRKWWTEHN